MLTFPLLAIGAMFGETFKTFFSDPIIGLMEACLLIFAGSRTYIRWKKLWIIESKRKEEKKSLEEANAARVAEKAYKKFEDEKSIDDISISVVKGEK